MKWNVNGYRATETISHQYATHIADAYSKASRFAKGLKNIDAPFTFRIPVFDRMPGNISPKPITPEVRK